MKEELAARIVTDWSWLTSYVDTTLLRTKIQFATMLGIYCLWGREYVGAALLGWVALAIAVSCIEKLRAG